MAKRTEFNNVINYLIETESDFTVHVSKNSQKIIIEDEKAFFTDKQLNPKIFHISNKIKEAADIFLHFNNIEFERNRINYYNYQHENLIDTKRFFYIDFSSAYITVLRNCKLISPELFSEINLLPKKERLISLGILAYEPFVLNYKMGKLIHPIQKLENPYSIIFFLACKLTENIIEHCLKLINYDYKFYWVDGIFFDKQEHYYKVVDYLKSIKFKFRFGSCFDLSVKKEIGYYNLKFNQTDKGEIEFKEYNIPVYFQEHKLKRENYEAMQAGNFDLVAENFKLQKKYGEIN